MSRRRPLARGPNVARFLPQENTFPWLARSRYLDGRADWTPTYPTGLAVLFPCSKQTRAWMAAPMLPQPGPSMLAPVPVRAFPKVPASLPATPRIGTSGSTDPGNQVLSLPIGLTRSGYYFFFFYFFLSPSIHPSTSLSVPSHQTDTIHILYCRPTHHQPAAFASLLSTPLTPRCLLSHFFTWGR